MKKEKIIFIVLIVLFSLLFIYSTFNIIKWFIDSSKTNKQIKEIQNNVTVNEVVDNENTEIIEGNEEVSKSNPYWDFIKLNMIDVDFSELMSTNKDTIGWIQVNGTNVNYPFVQTKDNSYYLNHSYDYSKNESGWVFLDYRNNINNLDKNTIIYAHGRNDRTMFGSLRFILNNGWINNKNNFVIKISTEKENSMWQIVSAYHIPVTSDYLITNFTDNNDFMEFANMIIDRSMYDFDTKINENDYLLTLSTCYNKTDRMVIHAKLIKKETKDYNTFKVHTK